MPTLLDFRRRIRSVKSSQQITRAMKFVAAARLRRAQEAALAARPYAQELARLLRSVMSRIQDVSNPLMAQREEKNILAIVMAGEASLEPEIVQDLMRHVEHEGIDRLGNLVSIDSVVDYDGILIVEESASAVAT